MTKTGARFYEIPSYSDHRGTIAILEWEKQLPFPIRRMFYTDEFRLACAGAGG